MPDRQTFPRRERLTRKREYEAVYREGKRAAGRELVCCVVRREGQGRKVGFSVSKRVGSAVVRNRVKRYLREAYRRHRAQVASDAHVVIIARPSAAGLRSAECEHALWRLLEKGDAVRG